MYALCGAVIGALAVTVPSDGWLSRPAFALDRTLRSLPQYMGAIAGWVLFSIYWEFAGRNQAPAEKAESRLSRGFHVALTNLALVLQMAPIEGLGRYVPVSALVMTAGLAVEATGLILAIWARRHLGRNGPTGWSGTPSTPASC